jgi:hypothetical protein
MRASFNQTPNLTWRFSRSLNSAATDAGLEVIGVLGEVSSVAIDQVVIRRRVVSRERDEPQFQDGRGDGEPW